MKVRLPHGEKTGQNERGFILVITMLILVVLSIIGISATNLTDLELKVAGNDRVHKKTFYQADAGTDVGLRMQYDNAICSVTSGGFKGNYVLNPAKSLVGKHILVDDLDFALLAPPASPATVTSQLLGGATPHLTYYTDIDLTGAGVTTANSKYFTDMMFGAVSKTTPGSGLQMVSGYDGLGASAAAGGTHRLYTVASWHHGELDSSSAVTIQWQMSNHILNNAASKDCKY